MPPTPHEYLRTPDLTATNALDAPISELAGISDEIAAVLKRTLQVETIHDLAESPSFEFAAEVARAVATPQHVYRRFGVPADRVVKEWEVKAAPEIAEAELSALEGIGDQRRADLENALRVRTVRDLAGWQPFLQARELLEEAKRGGGVRSKASVEGRLVTQRGAPAAGTEVRLYHKGFGDERTKLAETKTNARGFYSAQFKALDTTNLEIWAVACDGTEVRLSETKYRAGEHEVVNAVAPASCQDIDPEFTRLHADLSRELGGFGKLKNAREAADQRDLTLLHGSTGWDARLIGFASTATKLSEASGIDAEPLYGAFRVGLPTAAGQLGQVSQNAVKKALKKAVQSKIVTLSDQQIEAASKQFESFARGQRWAAKAPGAASTYADFIGKSGLSNAELTKFEDAYFAARTRNDGLWKRAKDNGVPEEKVEALRLQGKLGYLTLNSAGLAATLQDEIGSAEKLNTLVDKGLYDEGSWQEKLREAARKAATAGEEDQALEAMIPTAYGGKPDERLDAYSADLARKVRLSFPTQVVGAMIEKGDLSLGPAHTALKAPVQRFLKNAKQADPAFELGRAPLDVFVRDHKAQLFAGVPDVQIEPTVGAVKTLQRIYQVTPSNESMKVLLDHGFGSAHDVAAFPYDTFIARYGPRFPSLNEARLVYRKAAQVSAVTYSVFTAAKQLETAPGVHALAPAPELREKAKTELVKRYPKLESLFGSLDFCECEHCRSVLSPAAYLVDLLQFLDDDPLVWSNFLTDWKSRHGGEEYQKYWNKKQGGSARTAAERKPYDALMERRPDLAHLPLTCENTHTALPYIDLVNEILEYHVANGKLAAEAGHDTGSATTAELLAEPQNILPVAYQKLNGSLYPMNLPFDLWLETVRSFLGHFDVSHGELLEAFRRSEALIPKVGDPYGHRAIFVEATGMSDAEYALFANPTPLADWFKLYGYSAQAEALAELKSAKKLSRRLGVSYKELVQLVQTWFVNPDLDALVLLRRLQVEPSDVFRYKEHTGYPALSAAERAVFEKRLHDLSATHGASAFGPHATHAREWLEHEWQAGTFANILVLADRHAGSTFDATVLRYADGRDAEPIVFHKLNLFVRLWKRLAWALQDTDRALLAFIPRSLQPVSATNLGAGLRSAVVYISHLIAVEHRLGVGQESRQKLMALWSNVSTRGDRPLYAQLFLSPGVLKNAPAFDHPLGQYLTDATKLARDHLPALQAATGLNAEDVRIVLMDHGVEPDTVALSVDVASALYRYSLLSGALGLSIRELIALKSLSGFNPFKPLAPDELTTLANDHPFNHTIEFLKLVDSLRALDLSVADLEYLVQHVADPRGPYRPNPAALMALFRGLSAAIRRIEMEHALSDEPLTVNDDLIRQKLALVFDSEVVDTFLGMWTGVAVPSEEFFDKHFVATTFFESGDYDILFGTQEAPRRARLVQRLLPYVRHRLASQRIVEALVAHFDAEPQLVEALLTDATLISEPGGPSLPLRNAFAAASASGVDVKYYASGDTSGPVVASAVVPSISKNESDPLGTNSATFEGYLEVPVSGLYHFFASIDSQGGEAASGQAELTFEHLIDPLLNGSITPLGAATELRASVPYRFRLRLLNLAGRPFSLDVQSTGVARANASHLELYPKTAVDLAHRALLVLTKALLVVDRLALSEREVRHHFTPRGKFDPSALPTAEDRAGSAERFAMLRPILDYAHLRRSTGGTDDLVDVLRAARRTYPPRTDPGTAKEKLAAEVLQSFARLVRRDVATVREAVAALGLAPTYVEGPQHLSVEFTAFLNAKGLERLWGLLELVGKLGVSPSAALPWATPTPNFSVAQELKNTLRAQYEQDTWHRVAKSVFDKLRKRQRDALVAWAMRDLGFERIEELFEYFLIDPGMEPVVQTSRLSLATTSVQLFIQRALLNLEPHAHASTINSKRWQWMKRYRAWEANRKLWLFPENWLEPEFRDDKTHLFQELEGSLLQHDISEERAEDAFFHYVKKLEALARLEMVSMYCEEQPLDPNSNTLHVIGRTYNQPRKYFYRRYTRQMWTPWEPVAAEIEGDHVATVMWRGRLHLFWVTFLEKADTESGPDDTPRSMADKKKSELNPLREVQAQLSWTEYSRGQWSTRESTGFGALSAKLEKGFEARQVYVHVSKEFNGDTEGAVRVHLSSPFDKAFRLVSKNSPPEVKEGGSPQELPYSWDERRVTQYRGSGALDVTYVDKIVSVDGKAPESTSATQGVLLKGGQFALLGCGNSVELPTKEVGALTSPLFYQDNRHTFFVEPSLREVTIEQWEEWVIPLPDAELTFDKDTWWDLVPIEPFVPHLPPSPPIGPVGPGWVDPRLEILETLDPGSRFRVQPGRDWATDPSTIVQFDDGFIGKGGSIDSVVLNRLVSAGSEALVVDIDAGGELGLHAGRSTQEMSATVAAEAANAGIAGADVLVPGARVASQFTEIAPGDQALNIVNQGGLNSAVLSRWRQLSAEQKLSPVSTPSQRLTLLDPHGAADFDETPDLSFGGRHTNGSLGRHF